jgi:phospholipid transport system substrate-binding protein
LPNGDPTLRGRFSAALVLVPLLCGNLEAGPPTEELRGFFAAAVTALTDPTIDVAPEERLAAVRRIVTRLVDFPVAAQLSLGRAWQARSAAEREEFVQLFGSVLTSSFFSRFVGLARMNGGLDVRYVGEEIAGNIATVRTLIGGSETPVDYTMIWRGDRWLVRDVVIDGVSVVANYRAQLGRILGTSSYADLVGRMRARLGLSTVAAREQKPVPGPPPPDPLVAAGRGAPAVVVEPPTEARVATRPEPAPAEVRRVEPKPVELRPAEAKPAEPRPSEARVVELKPAEAKPVHATPAVLKPETPRPGAPVLVSRTGGRTFWVQVASLRTKEAARRLEGRLRAELPLAGTLVTPGPGPGGETLMRVRVGPYPFRADAARVAAALRAKGYEPFIAE